MKKSAIFLAIIGLILIVIAVFILSRPHLSDQQALSNQLNQALEDGKNGEPSSAVEMISKQFELNGSPESRTEIAKAIDKYHPKLVLTNQQTSITGDTGTIKADGALSVQFGPASNSVPISQITFNFKKISDKVWLFFPSSHWMLESVDVPQSSISQVQGALQSTSSGLNNMLGG